LIRPFLNATNSLEASSNQEQGTFMNIKTHSSLSAGRRGLKALGSLIALLMLTAGAATGVVPTPKEIRGPFPIMSTVYFEDGSVDYDGLKRELRWVDDSGCPGVIWCQSNDSIDLLTNEEKFRGFEACAEAAEGRKVVLTLGASGTNTAKMLELAAEIERVAERHPGVKMAIISRPPDDVRTEADIEQAWNELAKVAKRPVILQTYGTPATPTPSVALLVRLAEKHPAVYGYVKEEAEGYSAVERMSVLSAAKPVIKTAMAGWGGWQWLLQLRQCGCEGLVTERCAFAPVLAKLWSIHESGDHGLRLTEAYAMFRLLCDQRNFPSGLRGYPLYFLEKEGVFRNRVSRQYTNSRVTDGGSFGVGKVWKLEKTELTPLQCRELDALYRDMLEFVAK
jgi:dihydrodipicolinate synthase/N-acetylneuraminate lyase